jgi:hypothetical protein
MQEEEAKMAKRSENGKIVAFCHFRSFLPFLLPSRHERFGHNDCRGKACDHDFAKTLAINASLDSVRRIRQNAASLYLAYCSFEVVIE